MPRAQAPGPIAVARSDCVFRAALERILVDLETRSVDDPNVQRLRRFIALRDDAWKACHDRGRRHGRRRDRLDP